MHDAEELEQQDFGLINNYTNTFHLAQADKTLSDFLDLAEKNHVPVVSPNVGNLLATLVTIKQPRCILELGTAYGVSTYHMKKMLQSEAKLITVDLVEERQKVAKDFLEKMGVLDDNIVFLCKDFRDDIFFQSLYQKYEAFDFIFIDAAKGQYQHLLDLLTPMLAENGIIVFDNIFLNGWIINNSYPNHRQKTAFLRMKKFLSDIKNNEAFISTMVPFDDGTLILVKK